MMDSKTVMNGGIVVFKTKPSIVVDIVLLIPALAMWYLLYRVDKYFNNEITSIACLVFALTILGVTLRYISSIFVGLFTRYYLTTKAIIVKSGGLFSRGEISIPINEIMSISTSGNILWSLFGYSNMFVHTYSGAVVPFFYIKRTKKFKRKIEELKNYSGDEPNNMSV